MAPSKKHLVMQKDEVKPVVYDFAYLLQLCGKKLELERGREVHGQEAGEKADSVTLVSVLPAVADIKDLRIGKAIH
ncbi:hypothetical protein RYX36_017297, partial [Vicia faba]